MPTPLSYYTPAEQALIQHPDTMSSISGHVGAGGALEDLCRMWSAEAEKNALAANLSPNLGVVRFAAIWRWICEDRERFAAWLASNNVQVQADVARADGFLRAVAFADVRGLFDAQGRVLPPSDWPYELQALCAGLDVAEMFAKDGEEAVLTGLLKKIKLSDRLKANELLLKRRGALAEKVEHSGVLKLEDMVIQARAKGETNG